MSAAYAEFQSFLSLGCNGSPAQGYPTILVILSTIPSEVGYEVICRFLLTKGFRFFPSLSMLYPVSLIAYGPLSMAKLWVRYLPKE